MINISISYCHRNKYPEGIIIFTRFVGYAQARGINTKPIRTYWPWWALHGTSLPVDFSHVCQLQLPQKLTHCNKEANHCTGSTWGRGNRTKRRVPHAVGGISHNDKVNDDTDSIRSPHFQPFLFTRKYWLLQIKSVIFLPPGKALNLVGPKHEPFTQTHHVLDQIQLKNNSVYSVKSLFGSAIWSKLGPLRSRFYATEISQNKFILSQQCRESGKCWRIKKGKW